MVRQDRIMFEIGDVVAFKVRCSTCQGEVADKLSRLARHTECPLCRQEWDVPNELSASRQLLQALSAVVANQDEPSRTIRFEIDGEHA